MMEGVISYFTLTTPIFTQVTVWCDAELSQEAMNNSIERNLQQDKHHKSDIGLLVYIG